MRCTGLSPRLLRSLVAVAASGLLLAGCGVVEGGAGGGGEEHPVVRFGATQNPSSIGTVAELIKSEQLDEQCGITMEISYFSPDAADVALLSGQTDVGYFGYNSWASSPEKLHKLDMLAPLQAEHGTLFVPENSPAKSLEDLKGKKLALLPQVSGQYQDFKMLVAKMGMDLERDFEPVTGPPPAIEAFLKRGQVAGAILFEPNATNLEQEGGYRPLFKLTEKWQELTGNPLYMLGIAANSAWLDQHKSDAQCAASAVRKATDMLANDPSVFEGLKQTLKAHDDEHLAELTKNLGAIYTPESAEEAAGPIMEQLEEAKQLGMIPAVPERIFTQSGS